MSTTSKYYQEHAKEYYEASIAPMPDSFYSEFLGLLKPGSRIIDYGCGSGRDVRYFLEHGFEADGMDGCAEMCALASQHTGKKIYTGDLRTWKPHDETIKYDAVWACASLLHLPEEDLVKCFGHIQTFLADEAIIFASMKSGVKTGCDENGRFFCNYSDSLLKRILQENPFLVLVKKTETLDSHGREGFIWINLLFRYQKNYLDI